jgi:hypothetical protein
MLTHLPAELRVRIYKVATENYKVRTWARVWDDRQKDEWPWKCIEGLQTRFFVQFVSRHCRPDDYLGPQRADTHAGLFQTNKLIRGEFIAHLSAGGVSFGVLNDSGDVGLEGLKTFASLVPDPWSFLITTIIDTSRHYVGAPEYPALRLRHGFLALKRIEKSAMTLAYCPETTLYTQWTRPAFGKLLEDLVAASLSFCTKRLDLWVRTYNRASGGSVSKEVSNVKWIHHYRIGHLKVFLRRTDNSGTVPPYRELHLEHIAVCHP